jgi:hypothetical protein
MAMATQRAAYLTLTRISGDPEMLLTGYRESASTMNGVGRDHGLILHAAAATDDGLLMLNLWPSQHGSESASRDPRRLAQLNRHGLELDQMSREHHNVANYVLFT